MNQLQRKIVAQLKVERLTPQELSQKMQHDVQELILELGTLEILGVVHREAGNRFYLPIMARQ